MEEVNEQGEFWDLPSTPQAERKRRVHATPAPVGSGPTGFTCRDCKHAYKRSGGSRYYWKCALVKPSHGEGTDIRLKWDACARFEQGTP